MTRLDLREINPRVEYNMVDKVDVLRRYNNQNKSPILLLQYLVSAAKVIKNCLALHRGATSLKSQCQGNCR